VHNRSCVVIEAEEKPPGIFFLVQVPDEANFSKSKTVSAGRSQSRIFE
jgi:hypothetical protein